MPSVLRACVCMLACAAAVAGPSARSAPVHRAARPGVVASPDWPGGPMLSAHPLLRPAAARADQSIAGITSTDSLNWAGYAVSGRRERFAAVSATWFVPYLTCTRARGKTLSSAWVGLDGFAGKPDSVEQAGIAADCSSTGRARYYAWWEMFPRAETRTALAVGPGDSVTASVSYNPKLATFRLQLADTTSGRHFAVTRRCPDMIAAGHRVRCPRNSAEVITEAPATSASSRVMLAHLSDYGAVSFSAIAITNAARRRSGLMSARWAATEITQLRPPGTVVVAKPTSAQPSAFDIYWRRPN
jgi:hypothetical protein